jgi:energy-coupling factor transporter ATP-binding protein EcfA2
MLRAENLTCLRDGRTVLDQIDLHVLPGETVALLGPPGAGKTAGLEVFAGRLAPVSGRVFVAGADLFRDPAAAFAAMLSAYHSALPKRPHTRLLWQFGFGKPPPFAGPISPAHTSVVAFTARTALTTFRAMLRVLSRKVWLSTFKYESSMYSWCVIARRIDCVRLR